VHPLPHSEEYSYSKKDGCKKTQRCINLHILRIEELPKNMQKSFFTTSTRWQQPRDIDVDIPS
jgi:hypothetical protein